MNYIVELSQDVWRSSFGRTLVMREAKKYETKHGAKVALGIARRERPWRYARIVPVPCDFPGTNND